VLAQPNVRYVIVLEGINDIGRLKNPKIPGDNITADDLIAGYSQLIARAHAHGIKIFGATLTPYLGAGYSSDAGQEVRDKVNAFIRSGAFDGVVDFDKATQDPANPKQFLPVDDSGDHLHPNDAGYKAMGDAIDLKLFTN
jgi:lysophospholipase L1-like esterase